MRRWLKGEPTLREVLDDPVIRLMMRRDRVDPDHLHMFLRDVSTRLPSVELPARQHYRRLEKSLGM